MNAWTTSAARTGLCLLMCGLSACASVEPAHGESLTDARQEQRLRITRYQEITTSPVASTSARIEAHMMLGKHLMGEPEQSAQAREHLQEARRLWDKHGATIPQPAYQRTRSFIAQASFLLGELKIEQYLKGRPAPTPNPIERVNEQRFRALIEHYQDASYHAFESQAFTWFIAAQVREGDVIAHVVRMMEVTGDERQRRHQELIRRQVLEQALSHYEKACEISPAAHDEEGLKWRRIALLRRCEWDKVRCDK